MKRSHKMKRMWGGESEETRYYVDGKRVTLDDYEYITTMARMFGTQDTFVSTINKYGRFESTHYATYELGEDK